MQPYTNIDAYLVLGFGFGFVLFFRGLRTFRTSLMVADTPTTPIRAIAMGIAQARGRRNAISKSGQRYTVLRVSSKDRTIRWKKRLVTPQDGPERKTVLSGR